MRSSRPTIRRIRSDGRNIINPDSAHREADCDALRGGEGMCRIGSLSCSVMVTHKSLDLGFRVRISAAQRRSFHSLIVNLQGLGCTEGYSLGAIQVSKNNPMAEEEQTKNYRSLGGIALGTPIPSAMLTHELDSAISDACIRTDMDRLVASAVEASVGFN